MTEISAEMAEAAALRKELMRLMREDFDPTPPGWEGREWDDNAEDVADKMLVVVSSMTSLAMSAVRAAKMLIDNINEFGQVTDPVFLDCAETSIKAALAVRESTHVWQDIASAPQFWSIPVLLAWWENGTRKLEGKRVAFTGRARWFAANPDGSGYWLTDTESRVDPAQAYAWMPDILPPPLSASGDSHE